MVSRACRVVAWWPGDQVAYPSTVDSLRADAAAEGREHRVVSAATTVAREADPDADLLATLRLARERGLPSVYPADGMTFGTFTPLHAEHGGPAIGLGSVVDRVGDAFMLTGWLHPDAAATARTWSSVSPGLWIEAAAIDGDALVVSRSFLVELSLTDAPALDGTELTIGPVQDVPAAEWTVLSRGCEAFGGAKFGTLADLDRLAVAAVVG